MPKADAEKEALDFLSQDQDGDDDGEDDTSGEWEGAQANAGEVENVLETEHEKLQEKLVKTMSRALDLREQITDNAIVEEDKALYEQVLDIDETASNLGDVSQDESDTSVSSAAALAPVIPDKKNEAKKHQNNIEKRKDQAKKPKLQQKQREKKAEARFLTRNQVRLMQRNQLDHKVAFPPLLSSCISFFLSSFTTSFLPSRTTSFLPPTTFSLPSALHHFFPPLSQKIALSTKSWRG